MGFWKNLFGTRNAATQGATASDAVTFAAANFSLSEGKILGPEKDVEALCVAAYNALHFVTRHNLNNRLYGDANIYRDRVLDTFFLAATKLLPEEEVTAIMTSSIEACTHNPPWPDEIMCSGFLLLLDQAVHLIGHKAEIMPLILLKTDLTMFGRK